MSYKLLIELDQEQQAILATLKAKLGFTKREIVIRALDSFFQQHEHRIRHDPATYQIWVKRRYDRQHNMPPVSPEKAKEYLDEYHRLMEQVEQA